jgi:hypothetical protein
MPRCNIERAVAQLLVEQCADLLRFLKSKESAYQKAVVSICRDDDDESQLKTIVGAVMLGWGFRGLIRAAVQASQRVRAWTVACKGVGSDEFD